MIRPPRAAREQQFLMPTLDPNRFDLTASLPTMKAVVTNGIGGYDRLEYRDVPRPVPSTGEALVQVRAAGVNNTEINTRVGWYASTVTTGTEAAAAGTGAGDTGPRDGGWRGATPFPLIQGTDCCGQVVAVGTAADRALVGSRVLVRPCMRAPGGSPLEDLWLGSDLDGAFAQFVCVPVGEVFPVLCSWTDAELASIPCAYGTAENMLLRARLGKAERVLISGASGGVGSAAVQLAKLRGAVVTAMAAPEKFEAVRNIGADHAIGRDADPVASLGERSVDLVIDTVGGPMFPGLLRVLRRGGRYACAGAIAGALVNLDMRILYLNDLTLIGCTSWEQAVFPSLIEYIEHDRIRPLVAKTFALADISEAQREFGLKMHVGKLVLIPPPPAHAA